MNMLRSRKPWDFQAVSLNLGPEQPHLQAVNRLWHPVSLMHWPRCSPRRHVTLCGCFLPMKINISCKSSRYSSWGCWFCSCCSQNTMISSLGVQRWQPHCHSGLATLPSVDAAPSHPHSISVDWGTYCVFLYVCLFIVLVYFVLFAFLGFLYFCSIFSSSTLILLVGSFDL